MTGIAMETPAVRTGGGAGAALTGAAAFWWFVAVFGQWAFLYYIAVFYGTSTFAGDFAAWSKNTFLVKGYVAGDTAGNLAFAAHALLAAVTSFGGAIQLIPQVRRYAIGLHRWNGRVFLTTAFGVSLTGLYMIWVRGETTSLVSALGISVNAALIMLCGVLTWRRVLAGDIAAHRRWALRTYLVANAQWFTRVGVFGTFIIAKVLGLSGGKGFGGAVLQFWTFGCYLLPLAVLEIYLLAKEGGSAPVKFGTAGLLVVLTLLMAAGVFGVSLFVWWPLIGKV